MTQYLKDDSFLALLGHLRVEYNIQTEGTQVMIRRKITAHAEDARDDKRSLGPRGERKVEGIWNFGLKNVFQNVLSGDLGLLPKLCDVLLDEIEGINFFTSHDEQGNGTGFAQRNHLAWMLLALGRGVPLEFPFSFWHFFRDGDSPIDGVALLAEKIGLVNLFTEKDWPLLTHYHSYFKSLGDLKAFANDLHNQFYTAYAQRPYNERARRIKTLIESDAPLKGGIAAKQLPDLVNVHFKQIFSLIKNKEFNADPAYELFMVGIRHLRKTHPWLTYCDSPLDYKRVENGVAIIGRANPLNLGEQVVALTNWSGTEKPFMLPANQLPAGKWKVVSQSPVPLKLGFKEMPDTFVVAQGTPAFVTLPPKSGAILERIPEKKIDIDWEPIHQIFNPRKSYPLGHPTEALLVSSEVGKSVPNLDSAGRFHYQNVVQYFGFSPNTLHLIISKETSLRAKAIYIKDNKGFYHQVEDYDIRIDEHDNKDAFRTISVDLKNVVIEGQNFSINGNTAQTISVVLSDFSAVSFSVPR